MKSFILPKDRLKDFLKALGGYDLLAPVKQGDITAFEHITKPEEAVLDLKNQPLPPKKIIFPQTETLFSFDKKNAIREPELQQEKKQRIIFGIRPCDASSFCMIDPVYENDYPDPYYLEKRNATTLIGIQCSHPFSHCFCTSVGGSPAASEGLDLLFIELEESYFLHVLSAKGEKVVKETSALLTSPTPEQEEEKKRISGDARKRIPRTIDIQGLPESIEDSFEDPVWKELAQKCISCGICTYTCPTCYCFDIQDEKTRGGGKRLRIWDSCMFSEYTLHASGHNPRPTRVERLRNRMYHKFKQNIELYGVAGCVGCGRCIRLCPVHEDLIENLQRIKKL